MIKKVIGLLALMIILVGGLRLSIDWLMYSPYWSEIITGLIVGGLCLFLILGMLAGGLWTYLSVKLGARMAGPGYVAGEQTETARLRAIRDGIRIFGPGQARLPPPAEQRPWLPPLQSFEVDYEEMPDSSGGD